MVVSLDLLSCPAPCVMTLGEHVAGAAKTGLTLASPLTTGHWPSLICPSPSEHLLVGGADSYHTCKGASPGATAHAYCLLLC